MQTADWQKEMGHPLVHIIVPSKNAASTIEKCINSLMNQTYQNLEIMVVDNNSEDGTRKIVREL